MSERDPLIYSYTHLREFRREQEALHTLKKIASLVKPIMRARGWKVRELAEFYPSQHSLLGESPSATSTPKLTCRVPPPNTPQVSTSTGARESFCGSGTPVTKTSSSPSSKSPTRCCTSCRTLSTGRTTKSSTRSGTNSARSSRACYARVTRARASFRRATSSAAPASPCTKRDGSRGRRRRRERYSRRARVRSWAARRPGPERTSGGSLPMPLRGATCPCRAAATRGTTSARYRRSRTRRHGTGSRPRRRRTRRTMPLLPRRCGNSCRRTRKPGMGAHMYRPARSGQRAACAERLVVQIGNSPRRSREARARLDRNKHLR